MKKNGFTIAELLITMIIIGVIAITTVPALFRNVGKQKYEAAIKTQYNAISNAVKAYMAEQETNELFSTPIVSGENNDKKTEALKDFVNSQFKIVLDCDGYYYSENNDIVNCFAPNIHSHLKTTHASLENQRCRVSVLLSNGSGMCINSGKLNDTDVTSNDVTEDIVLQIDVDTNGPSAPNISGKDLFRMYVDNSGKVHGNYDNANEAISREDFLEAYTTSANFMPIGLVQEEGWKINY